MVRKQLVILAVVLLLAGCGGGGGNTVTPPGLTASFLGSGTAAQADGVRLTAGASRGDTVTVQVVCGETTHTDVYGFAFDLVLGDPSVVEYVASSVQAGDAFNGQPIVEAVQVGGRIVIGVAQTDQTGDRIAGPESVVVRLTLKVLRTGTSSIRFEGSTGTNPTNDPAAVDSSGTPIGTVVFDATSATVIGR